MRDTQSCGEALVHLLERRGVDIVFGIPGVHTLDLYRGLSQSSIRHVLVRHEQGAGFMADGYARLSGRPGVCFVITGPGVTNIATPMAQAYSDSIPMLVISTVRATGDLENRHGKLHEITNQLSVTKPLSAFAATAMSPEQLPGLIDRAFAVFESERPRPVHIEIPLDIAAMPVEGDWWPAPRVRCPKPDPTELVTSADVLRKATMPAIIAGGGALGAVPELVHLAEYLGAPVVTTVASKGLMADDHPLYLGNTLSCLQTQEFLGKADVVLAVGTELSETDSWCDKLTFHGDLVRIDIDRSIINNPYPATAGIIGDAVAILKALVLLLSNGDRVVSAPVENKVLGIRQAIRKNESELMQTHRRVLEIMHAVLPADAVIYADMTQIAYSGNVIYPVSKPRSWFHPSGYGTLGYALPAAIGAKLAEPSLPIVALAGDYGFQFTVQELAVAVELDLPLTIILWNNDALGQIRDDMIAQGFDKVGVQQLNPDFRLLAGAYGTNYLRPEGKAALEAGLTRAMNEPGLWLIDVRQSAFS